MGGVAVKAAKHISIGDEYEIKTETRKWVIKVTALLGRRVQYTEAVNFYSDITPEDEKKRLEYQAAVFYTGKRKTKIGRPTKKQRRDLGDFMDT